MHVSYTLSFLSLTLKRLTEPDLLEKVISDGNWTEVKVTELIKKLLIILRELEALQILHLDIKVLAFIFANMYRRFVKKMKVFAN